MYAPTIYKLIILKSLLNVNYYRIHSCNFYDYGIVLGQDGLPSMRLLKKKKKKIGLSRIGDYCSTGFIDAK